MRKAKKEGWTFGAVRRYDAPAVRVGEAEATFRINGAEVAPSSMIVFVTASDPGATRKLKFFCKKNAIGWKHLELNAFNVVGLWPDLLRLTDQSYIGDWHYDKDATVMGASGAGDKPKRAKQPRFTPTSDKGVKAVKETLKTDERHAGAGKTKPPRPHGDDTLDKIEERKKAEQQKANEEFYGQWGINPPKD